MWDPLKFAALLSLVSIWIGLLWVVTALRGKRLSGRREGPAQD